MNINIGIFMQMNLSRANEGISISGNEEVPTEVSRTQLGVDCQSQSDKGKSKILEDANFNNNGLLSQTAIEILDGGGVDCISRKAKRKRVHWDEEVLEGLTLKDLLEAAVESAEKDKAKKAARGEAGSGYGGPCFRNLEDRRGE